MINRSLVHRLNIEFMLADDMSNMTGDLRPKKGRGCYSTPFPTLGDVGITVSKSGYGMHAFLLLLRYGASHNYLFD